MNKLGYMITDTEGGSRPGYLIVQVDDIVIAEISDCGNMTDNEAWDLALEVFEEQYPDYTVDEETGLIARKEVVE